jgi:hypothetical protein
MPGKFIKSLSKEALTKVESSTSSSPSSDTIADNDTDTVPGSGKFIKSLSKKKLAAVVEPPSSPPPSTGKFIKSLSNKSLAKVEPSASSSPSEIIADTDADTKTRTGKFITSLSKKGLAVAEPPSSPPPTTGKFIKSLSKKKIASVEGSSSGQLIPRLTPITITPQDKKSSPSKKKRGKASRENLKKKRANKHAVLIQSKWRGHCARKSIADQRSHKKSENQQEPDPDNAEEEILEDFKKIPFQGIKRVQFYVDNAVGLPVNCTACRVSCRLIQQDRTPLSEAGESFSDPESFVSSPEFDLFMTWKGNGNLPIVLRSD